MSARQARILLLAICADNIADRAGDLCHSFVGEMIPRSNNMGQSITACRECQRPLCLLCGGRFEHNPTDDSHRCVPIDTADAAFEGLKRGKGYQICPSERCGMRIELSEACNAMRCHCGTTLCYICGEPATRGAKTCSANSLLSICFALVCVVQPNLDARRVPMFDCAAKHCSHSHCLRSRIPKISLDLRVSHFCKRYRNYFPILFSHGKITGRRDASQGRPQGLTSENHQGITSQSRKVQSGYS